MKICDMSSFSPVAFKYKRNIIDESHCESRLTLVVLLLGLTLVVLGFNVIC